MSNNLDKFTESLDERPGTFSEAESRAINKTSMRIKRTKRIAGLKNLGVFFMLLALISFFIPGTPTNALAEKLFSWVPGLGFPKTDEAVIGVLENSVTKSAGKGYVTVNWAYSQENHLTVGITTNIGLENWNMQKEDLLKYLSGEINPKPVLLLPEGPVMPYGMTTSGPSLKSGAFSIEANYFLPERKNDNNYELAFEGFEPVLRLNLKKALTNELLENVKGGESKNGFHVFSEIHREGDDVTVRFSVIPPAGVKNPRLKVFEDEADIFTGGVFLETENGDVFERNIELEDSNDVDINTFCFTVPEHVKGLKAVIPFVLYEMPEVAERKVGMPGEGHPVDLNLDFSILDNVLTIGTMKRLTDGDYDEMPEDFIGAQGVIIEYGVPEYNVDAGFVYRVLPRIKVGKGLFGDFNLISHTLYALPVGQDESEGVVFVAIDDVDYNKLKLTFDVECGFISEIEIPLE